MVASFVPKVHEISFGILFTFIRIIRCAKGISAVTAIVGCIFVTATNSDSLNGRRAGKVIPHGRRITIRFWEVNGVIRIMFSYFFINTCFVFQVVIAGTDGVAGNFCFSSINPNAAEDVFKVIVGNIDVVHGSISIGISNTVRIIAMEFAISAQSALNSSAYG